MAEITEQDKQKAAEIAREVERKYIQICAPRCYCGNLNSPPCDECVQAQHEVVTPIAAIIASAIATERAEERKRCAEKVLNWPNDICDHNEREEVAAAIRGE